MLEESRNWKVVEDIQPIQSCRTNRFVEQQVDLQAMVVFPGGHEGSSNTSIVEILTNDVKLFSFNKNEKSFFTR